MKIETPPPYDAPNHHSTTAQSDSELRMRTIPHRPVSPSYAASSPGECTTPIGSEHASQGTETLYGDENTYTQFAKLKPGSEYEYNGLPLEEARCILLPNFSAAWIVRGKEMRLCTLAAAVLIKEGILDAKNLEIYQSKISQTDSPPEPTDPISGVLSATHGTVGGVLQGLADYPIEISRMMKKENQQLAKGMAVDFARDKGKGISRIVGTGLRAPMDFTLNLARGFHNTPKLYGDKTVRETEKVTGLSSGLKVAGKGFTYGLYDGVSGIFTQPYEGARENGIVGGITGFAKGIGGAVCKPTAGACGLPAYAFKGLYEEVHKKRGFNMARQIAAAQITQGEEEWRRSAPEQRGYILSRWYNLCQEKYQ